MSADLIDPAAPRPPDALVLANRRVTVRSRLDALRRALTVVRAANAAFDEIVLHSPRPLPDILAATELITRAVCRLDRGTGDVVGVERGIAVARSRAGVEGA
jgi:hypothetical protein